MPLTAPQAQALSAGISAAGSLTNTAFNQIFAEHNRKRNFHYNEKAAENADKRQRAQYNDLYSPQAMMEQYAAAGLSPSMMMSGGQSAVGQSSAQGNQSAGIQGAYPSGQVIDPVQMAQIANINADTKLKENEAANVSENTTAQQIENYINATTLPQTIEKAQEELNVLVAEVSKLKAETSGINWKNAFNVITQDEQVQALINKNAELEARVIELQAQTALHNKDVELKEQERQTLIEQCKKWQHDTAQRYIELDIYAEEQAAQEAWFEEQAYQGMKRINLDTEMFNFERGEKWEFEKYKVGHAIEQQWWKVGLDFGASVINSVSNFAGTRSLGKSSVQVKQMEIDERQRTKTTHTQNYHIDKKGRKVVHGGSYKKTN